LISLRSYIGFKEGRQDDTKGGHSTCVGGDDDKGEEVVDAHQKSDGDNGNNKCSAMYDLIRLLLGTQNS
jgi:hypothetical protein